MTIKYLKKLNTFHFLTHQLRHFRKILLTLNIAVAVVVVGFFSCGRFASFHFGLEKFGSKFRKCCFSADSPPRVVFRRGRRRRHRDVKVARRAKTAAVINSN